MRQSGPSRGLEVHYSCQHPHPLFSRTMKLWMLIGPGAGHPFAEFARSRLAYASLRSAS